MSDEQQQTTAVAIPEYLKQFSGQQQGEVDSLASASISVPRVSLRGRQFRFVENGEEVFKANDNVDVIVLGVDPEAGRNTKVYYDKPYVSGSNEPPTCASHDGVRPSAWVQKPQHATCADCPKNQFGSATSRTGKPSKACRDSKTLWVRRAADNRPNPVTYGLNVTVSSLGALAEYGRKLKSHNVPITLAVTRMTMVDSEFPQLDFACVAFASETDAPKLMALAAEKPWKIFQVSSLQVLGAPMESGNPAALPSAVPAHVQAAAAAAPSGPVNVDDLTKHW